MYRSSSERQRPYLSHLLATRDKDTERPAQTYFRSPDSAYSSRPDPWSPVSPGDSKSSEFSWRSSSNSTINGTTDSQSSSGATSPTSPASSAYSSRYLSYGRRYGSLQRRDGEGVANGPMELELSGSRSNRDAFMRGDATPKYDPSLRIERDKDREKEKDKLQALHQQQQQQQQPHSAPPSSKSGQHHGQPVKEIDGYVGFANLPNQVYRQAVKRGFEFTLMVVGESGLGKSTLINSMFLTDLYNNEYPGPSHRIKKTVQVEQTKVLLKEGGVQLRLTVVDTPGFGDAVDNSNCWQPLTDHIESKYEEYLNAESRVNRKVMPDTRVHCCLYFVSPNGHGLKPLDIEFMKRLHDKVNIIPLIAKADTMTPDECRDFKKTILNEIAQHKIKIYEFPDCDDEEEAKIQKKLKGRVPFAVVGSNTVVDSAGHKVRGRVYPWGVVEVENLEHNDFLALRNMVIRTHMQDLKDVTNNVHYENYRYQKLASVTTKDGKNKNGAGNAARTEPVPAVRRKKLARSASTAPTTPRTTSSNNRTSASPPVSPSLSPRGASSPLSAGEGLFGKGSHDKDGLAVFSSAKRSLTSAYSEGSPPPNPHELDDSGVESSPVAARGRSRNERGPLSSSSSSSLPGSPVLNQVALLDPDRPMFKDELRERLLLIWAVSDPKMSPLLQMEEEKKEHISKMKKMEAEMEQVFEMKVKEKRSKLKESEAELQRRAEQMKKGLDQQERELVDRHRAFEQEQEQWEDQQRSLEEQRRSLENVKKQKKGLFQ